MGQQYEVNTDDGEDRVKAIAATVDARIREIRAHGKTVDSLKVVIQAALNLAEELDLLRRDHQALMARLQRLSDRLSKAVGDFA
jgi:cell division protein ZapA